MIHKIHVITTQCLPPPPHTISFPIYLFLQLGQERYQSYSISYLQKHIIRTDRYNLLHRPVPGNKVETKVYNTYG